MAVCDYCLQEMTTVAGCTLVRYDGETRDRIKYGEEAGDAYCSTAGPCHDCGATAGHYHHPGCDVERCPTCGGQAISCDCVSEGDDD